MNKIIKELVDRKVNEKLNDKMNAVIKAGEEELTMSRKVFTLQIAVALLGGIVLGMLISPRKKVSYKIASNNHDIGELAPDRHRAPGYDEYDEDEDEDEEEDSSGNDADDDDNDEDEAPDNGRSKFIKL